MNQTTTKEIIYRYEITKPWVDPQGMVHQPKDLYRELIAGGVLHPKNEPMKNMIRTQQTRHNPSFTVPDELVKVTKITRITVTTETVIEEEIEK